VLARVRAKFLCLSTMERPGFRHLFSEEVHLIGEGIEVSSLLDFFRNDDFAGAIGNAAEVGHEEVMKRTLPAAHAGADDFVVDVFRERSSFLPELGVSW
jgi:hypothetical protein